MTSRAGRRGDLSAEAADARFAEVRIRVEADPDVLGALVRAGHRL